MFRVPMVLDTDLLPEYCADECVSFRTKEDKLVLSFRIDEEPDGVDGDDWLSSLIPLRADLMRGDCRCLYLAWLSSIQGMDFENDILEPPVPAGLGDLTDSLEQLAEFLGIDPDLIAAAAERSKDRQHLTVTNEEIAAWVEALPASDRNDALVRIIEDEASHAAMEVRQRALREIVGRHQTQARLQDERRRTAGQILARAEEIEKERRRLQTQQAAREKAKRLESINGKEAELWSEVRQLVGSKQLNQYDKAVSILRDLRELAEVKSANSAFAVQLRSLCQEHAHKQAFLNRVHKAKLREAAAAADR
jgi:hypothetical protein